MWQICAINGLFNTVVVRDLKCFVNEVRDLTNFGSLSGLAGRFWRENETWEGLCDWPGSIALSPVRDRGLLL